jgi:hypothetical protein
LIPNGIKKKLTKDNKSSIIIILNLTKRNIYKYESITTLEAPTQEEVWYGKTIKTCEKVQVC